jgi:hypothetical protein
MIAELPLVGAGGEPVDFRRTLGSHGVAALPPSRIDEEAWTLEVTLPSGRGARTVHVSKGRPGYAHVEGATSSILALLRHMFRLDEGLSGFYALARDDPQLAWAADGAGRMLRSTTVFEDVVKTICTEARPFPRSPPKRESPPKRVFRSAQSVRSAVADAPAELPFGFEHAAP